MAVWDSTAHPQAQQRQRFALWMRTWVILGGLMAALVGCLPGERGNEPLALADAKSDAKADAATDGTADAETDTADGLGGDTAADVVPETADAGDAGDAAATADGDDATGDAADAPDVAVGLGGCVTDTDCNQLPYGPCAIGYCDIATGLCHGKNLDDDTPCKGGKCLADGAVCKLGACEGPAKSCDDGSLCTVDACDPVLGCYYTSLSGAVCTDGDTCTKNDICNGGKCVGTPANCNDGDVCTKDVCNPGTGECNHNQPTAPDNTLPCNGGGPCSGPAMCVGLQCVAKSLCDDSNPCTLDVCGTDGKCVNLPFYGGCKPAGASPGDKCAAGLCEVPADGGAPSCVAKPVCLDKPCLPATCDAATGQCSYPDKIDDKSACDDNNPCTVETTCQKGQCKGNPLACEDNNPCTINGQCDPVAGCSYSNTPNGAACNDGNGCTSTDKCTNGTCAGAPAAKVCDDANACTNDLCDPVTGCAHVKIDGCTL